MSALIRRTARHLRIALCAAFPAAALAMSPVSVVQKGRDFTTRSLSVAPGQVVRFENRDDFPHQINVTGPGMAFDSDLQEAGETMEVAFPAAGLFTVQCGIHPRMRMTVKVGTAP